MNPLDLTGQRFGRLVVQWPVGRKKSPGTNARYCWLCLCDCGNLHIAVGSQLVMCHGIRSCGCLKNEVIHRSHKIVQIPGQSYTFVNRKTGQKDSGILPDEYGLSNDFVQWNFHPGQVRGGSWYSKKFSRLSAEAIRKGEGPEGLLGRMKSIIKSSRQSAKNGEYLPIMISPEKMLQQWEEQQRKCKACGKLLEGMVSKKFTGTSTVYDHDHITGNGRGFLHGRCNVAEGILKSMSTEEFFNFVRYVRPEFLVSKGEQQ